jgi:hypothetical protein
LPACIRHAIIITIIIIIITRLSAQALQIIIAKWWQW